MSVSTISGPQKQFRSVSNTAKWVIGCFILLVIINIISVVDNSNQAVLISRAIGGETLTSAEIASIDNSSRLSYVFTILNIITGIAFLMWIHRAHNNLTSLHSFGLNYTPGWAVGWFFIPIYSFFRPYQVASEIWKASYPKADMSSDTSWHDIPTSSIVGWWWGLFLISNYIGSITMRTALRAILVHPELNYYLTVTYVCIVSNVMDIVGIIITVLMVQAISQNQEIKHGLIVQQGLEAA